MRSISEKKRSAAAIKSLLDLMAENRSLQSVYTMDGLYATSNHYESPPERSEKAVQNDQGKVSYYLNSGISFIYSFHFIYNCHNKSNIILFLLQIDHPAMETSSTDSYPNCNR